MIAKIKYWPTNLRTGMVATVVAAACLCGAEGQNIQAPSPSPSKVIALPPGISQGVVTLSPGISKGVITLNPPASDPATPGVVTLPSRTAKEVVVLKHADPNSAIVLAAPSKTAPILVTSTAQPSSVDATRTASKSRTASVASMGSTAAMTLTLSSSPALVQQWNNGTVLWLLPYVASGNTVATTNWVNTTQGFSSNPSRGPDLLALDINGDGKTDLVQQWNYNGILWLLPYISDGASFAATNWINTQQGYGSGPGGRPGLIAMDIDGDGKTDLVQQWNNGNTLWLLPYISNGAGFVATNWINTQQGFNSTPAGTPNLLVLDINGDGKADLVQQWDYRGILWLLPYISNGTALSTTNWINTGQPYDSGPGRTPGLLPLDLNGDGKTDLVQQWNNAGILWLLPYISDGTALSATNWINTGQGYATGPGNSPGLLALDLNGDGQEDLIQQWNNNGTLWLLPYFSSGTTLSTTNWINTGQAYGTGPAGIPDLLALDVNGDGKTDVVQQWNNNSTLWLLPYLSNGTTLATTNWINTGQGFDTTTQGSPGLLGGRYIDPVPWTQVINGQVVGTGAGTTVNLTGSAAASVSISSGGLYAFTVQTNGSYSVAPSSAGYAFSPPQETFWNVQANITADFQAAGAAGGTSASFVLNPTPPSKEYIYFGGKTAVIESWQ